MPILKREPDVFPGDLFALAPLEWPWWVAHVRSRQEKLAARESRLRGIPFYLPLREQTLRRLGRRRTSFLPLFSGYLFFRGPTEVRRELLQTNLCVRVLPVLDQAALQHDLFQVRRLQELGLPLVPHAGIAAGDLVEVKEGPFSGYTGVVQKEKGRARERLVVLVRFIHRAVSVELDRDEVEPLPARAQASARARRRVA